MDEGKIQDKWPKGLIPKANALICWRHGESQYGINFHKFKVVFCPFPDFFESEYWFQLWKEKEEARTKDLRSTWGAVSSNWHEMDNENIICECFRILIEDIKDYDEIDNAIYELGKIKEFECFRTMFWLRKLRNKIPRDTLESSYYGWDFCELPGGFL